MDHKYENLKFFNLFAIRDFNKYIFTTIRKEKHVSEVQSMLIFSVAMIYGGINFFNIKYISILFRDQYQDYSFMFWRSFFIIPLALILVFTRKIDIIPIYKVKNKFWFAVRSFGLFISFFTYIYGLKYLRLSTMNSISAMNPALVVFFSVFVIKEKFYMRYVYGILICLIGALMIVLNENRSTGMNDISDKKKIHEILLGCIWAFLNAITMALNSVAAKILNKENFCTENQMFYIGVVNSLCALIFSFFDEQRYGISFIISCFILVSIPVFFWNVLTIEALKEIDVSKTTALSYLLLVTVLILGVIFLDEPIYYSDIVGSSIIIGYNIYDCIFHLK